MSVGGSGLSENDLTIVGHGDNSTTVAIVSGSFNWNSTTNTATWKIDTDASSATVPFITGQFEIILSDSIEGLFDNQLDGEWTNPTSLADSDSSISEFPSGDGEAGGEFSFFFALLPGDSNRDNVVNFSDLNTLLTYYPTASGATWATADTNGDGVVNFADLNNLLTNYGFDFSAWPSEEMMRFGGGESETQVSMLTSDDLESVAKQVLKAHEAGKLSAELVDEIMSGI